MKRYAFFFMLVFACSALVTVPTTQAITIGFDPTLTVAPVGTTVDVDLFIAGLGDGIAPSISTFDIDIGFDPNIIGFNSAVFGDQLDILGLGSIKGATADTGLLNLFELSLDDSATLNTFQDPDFTLATITWDILEAGTSPLDLGDLSLGDSEGEPLFAEKFDGTISGDSVPVPEPGTILLVGAGFLGTFGCALRRKKRT
jgi:hypothetical protein